MSSAESTSLQLMRRGCARLAAGALYYSGALSLLRSQGHGTIDGAGGSPFVVLLYHRVNADDDPFAPALSVKSFDAQMRHLAAAYRVLPLTELVDRVRRGAGVEPGTIAITFDDGYRDNHDYAHAVLRKYHLPATLFVATSFIGTDRRMWNDQVAWAIKHSREAKVSLPGVANSFDLSSTPTKLRALEQILAHLKTLPEVEKLAQVDELCQRLHSSSRADEPLMLSWKELSAMANDGWDIGAHTANHIILTRVPAEQARAEITTSRAALERELGRPVHLFAYPNGKPVDYDQSIKEMLGAAGYSGAVTTVDRINDGASDPFAIGRKSPWENSLASFALKLKLDYWRAPAPAIGSHSSTALR